jgi:hypothetical protein
MNRQTLIDTLGEARDALFDGRIADALTAVNDVRDALLDGEPTESE